MGVLGVAEQGTAPQKQLSVLHNISQPRATWHSWILAGCRRRRSIKLVLSDGHLTPDPHLIPGAPLIPISFAGQKKKKSNGKRPPLANIPRGS